MCVCNNVVRGLAVCVCNNVVRGLAVCVVCVCVCVSGELVSVNTLVNNVVRGLAVCVCVCVCVCVSGPVGIAVRYSEQSGRENGGGEGGRGEYVTSCSLAFSASS